MQGITLTHSSMKNRRVYFQFSVFQIFKKVWRVNLFQLATCCNHSHPMALKWGLKRQKALCTNSLKNWGWRGVSGLFFFFFFYSEELMVLLWKKNSCACSLCRKSIYIDLTGESLFSRTSLLTFLRYCAQQWLHRRQFFTVLCLTT